MIFSTAKSFRRGTGLAEAKVEEERAAARAKAEAASCFPTVLHTGVSVGHASADAPIRVTSSTPLDRQEDDVGGSRDALRSYPVVPYYGLLSSLSVRVDVAVSACSPVEEQQDDRQQRRLNASVLEHDIPALERRLAAVAEQQGNSFTLSNCGCDHRHRRLGDDTGSGGSTASSVTYGAYINALTAVYREFHRLREPGDGHSPQHHTLHLRLSDHPRWRDLSALLALEDNRLVLFLSSSSRATQRYFHEQTSMLTQAMTWVAGAALASEPRPLSRIEPNPLLAAWNVLLSLPLTARVEAAAARESEKEPDFSSLLAATQPLDNFRVSIHSSLPFPGATRHTPVVRLVEVAPILSSPQRTAVPPEQSLVGRQFTWRIAVPAELSLARAAKAVTASSQTTTTPSSLIVPNLLSCVVACLVDQCHLDSFAISTATAGAVAPLPASGKAATETGVRGLTYVGVGGIAGDVTTRRGPSSQGWASFSRLSSMAWLTDGDRRAAGLMLLEDDGEESPLECEFSLDGVRYQRPRGQGRAAPVIAGSKRARDEGTDEEEKEENRGAPCASKRRREDKAFARGTVEALSAALGQRSPPELHPEAWGEGFKILFSVAKVMEAPSDEDEGTVNE